MWPPGVLECIGGTPALLVCLLGLPLLVVVVVVLALLLVLRRGSGLTLLLPLLLFGAASRVFEDRGHVLRPVWLGLVLWFIGRLYSRGGPVLGWCKFCASGMRSLSVRFLLSLLFHCPFRVAALLPSVGWL